VNSAPAHTDIIDEQDLVERLKKGQEWAFAILVKQYRNPLMKIAYGITLDREESLEIVQDVFVSVHKNIRTFRQEASLKGWLRKITVNHSLNWKRKFARRFRWKHTPLEQENDHMQYHTEEEQKTPETDYQGKEFENIVMNHIKTLPEKVRAVFVLNTFEGLSYD